MAEITLLATITTELKAFSCRNLMIAAAVLLHICILHQQLIKYTIWIQNISGRAEKPGLKILQDLMQTTKLLLPVQAI